MITNLQYPLDLVSRLSWKHSIQAEDIVACCPDAIIGHWLEGPKERHLDFSLGDDMVALQPDSLPLVRIPNLSCSLLGALFHYDHFHFLQTNEGKTPWTGESDITDTMLTTDNYTYMPEITVIGWTINGVASYVIEYEHIFQKRSDYNNVKNTSANNYKKRGIESVFLKEWENLKVDPNNDKRRIAELKGGVKVNHAPTNLNYWHFTIDSYPAESDIKPLKNASDGWRKNMAANLVDYLRRSFIYITEETAIPTITDTKVWEK